MKKQKNTVLENKTEEKKVEEIKTEETKKRQIILETDGNVIQLVKAEVASMIELQAILSMMLEALKKQ